MMRLDFFGILNAGNLFLSFFPVIQGIRLINEYLKYLQIVCVYVCGDPFTYDLCQSSENAVWCDFVRFDYISFDLLLSLFVVSVIKQFIEETFCVYNNVYIIYNE